MTADADRKPEIRTARRSDARAIAEIHVSSWRAAYRGILPDELLDGLSMSERERLWQMILGEGAGTSLALVADRGDSLVGFCSAATPSRDADAGEVTAEITAIYVAPDAWGRGAGRALMESAVDALREQSWRQVQLWVLAENERALVFYDRLGFEVEEGVEKREERSGRPVIRLRSPL